MCIRDSHRMTTSLNDGEHALTLTDDKGAHLNIGFRAVVSEEKE